MNMSEVKKHLRFKKASNKHSVEKEKKTEREFLKCKKKFAQEKKFFACFGDFLRYRNNFIQSNFRWNVIDIQR